MSGFTHASFFSGVGGTDLGLEAAGWETISFSEIEPYPCAVLAERWPEVVNLGDIRVLADDARRETGRREGAASGEGTQPDSGNGEPASPLRDRGDWRNARLFSGGFPCQDVSIAGARAGLGLDYDSHDPVAEAALTRSGLAFDFLDLVRAYRPEAVLMENVPGLLSSNAGRDLGYILRSLGDLRYGWAFRVLDAEWFGMPQRRRRLYILALDLERHPDPDSAGKVLSVFESCGRDHKKEREERAASARRAGRSPAESGFVRQAVSSKWSKQSSGPAGDEHHNLIVSGPITRRYYKSINTTLDDGALVVGAASDASGVRTPSRLAGGAHDREELEPPGQTFVKVSRAHGPDGDGERWAEEAVSPTLSVFDQGDSRAVTLVAATINSGGNDGGFRTEPGEHLVFDGAGHEDDPLLPVGLDSARFKAVGNGVAAPVVEWIGRRLIAFLNGELE